VAFVAYTACHYILKDICSTNSTLVFSLHKMHRIYLVVACFYNSFVFHAATLCDVYFPSHEGIWRVGGGIGHQIRRRGGEGVRAHRGDYHYWYCPVFDRWQAARYERFSGSYSGLDIYLSPLQISL